MSHEGSQMAWLGLVVLREGLHFAPVADASLPREESKGTVPRCSKLTMTLKKVMVRHRMNVQWEDKIRRADNCEEG